MINPKVISLSARPLQVSHLCFAVDGILGEFNPELIAPNTGSGGPNTALGAPVTAFGFDGFYETLRSGPTAPGDLSLLQFNFLQIQAFTKPFTLVALRAESAKVALNKAINARQNAYFAKYGNATDIISQIEKSYSASQGGTKPLRLVTLSNLAKQQATQLIKAYVGDKRTGVQRTTKSDLTSKTESSGGSSTQGKNIERTAEVTTPAAKFAPPSPGIPATPGIPSTPDTPGMPGMPDIPGILGTPDSPSLPGPSLSFIGTEGTIAKGNVQEGNNASNTTSVSRALESQTIVNTGYEYRIPFLECQAQHERAQISLIDEQFAQFMFGQNIPNLDQVFSNELNSIDGDVYRLQIAYLNTILMSPIPGIVTGIYKNPGECVRAGEPVVRVENNEEILLVATLIFRGLISIGSNVRVKTILFDDPTNSTTSIKGRVVAVRGQREDDQWEVIVKCKNLDSANKPIFPLGYHFDYDNTTFSIT